MKSRVLRAFRVTPFQSMVYRSVTISIEKWFFFSWQAAHSNNHLQLIETPLFRVPNIPRKKHIKVNSQKSDQKNNNLCMILRWNDFWEWFHIFWSIFIENMEYWSFTVRITITPTLHHKLVLTLQSAVLSASSEWRVLCQVSYTAGQIAFSQLSNFQSRLAS